MKMSLENFEFTEAIAAASENAGDVNGASIDHAKGPCGAITINCGTYAGGLSAKLQYSANNTDWTDEPDGTAGNDTVKTLTAVGTLTLFVPNPRARYSRVVVTLAGTCVICGVNAVGPLRHVDP